MTSERKILSVVADPDKTIWAALTFNNDLISSARGVPGNDGSLWGLLLQAGREVLVVTEITPSSAHAIIWLLNALARDIPDNSAPPLANIQLLSTYLELARVKPTDDRKSLVQALWKDEWRMLAPHLQAALVNALLVAAVSEQQTRNRGLAAALSLSKIINPNQ